MRYQVLVFVNFTCTPISRLFHLLVHLLLQRDGVWVCVLDVADVSTTVPLCDMIHLEGVQLLLHKKRLNQLALKWGLVDTYGLLADEVKRLVGVRVSLTACPSLLAGLARAHMVQHVLVGGQLRARMHQLLHKVRLSQLLTKCSLLDRRWPLLYHHTLLVARGSLGCNHRVPTRGGHGLGAMLEDLDRHVAVLLMTVGSPQIAHYLNLSLKSQNFKSQRL